ncbi:Zinc phosphodiesterase [Phytophthora megakarya]|uniref:ribonuclease Z n=1 Tax=Phytophthora megakarya TaxID=4795 RepID=A0A225WD02_9STRA|nr:Zinc phosphodiesterase [Phytophthora megakarya]
MAESIECDTWNEGDERSDQHAMVIPIALDGVGSSLVKSQACRLCEKNACTTQVEDSSESGSNSTCLDAKQVSDNQVGRRLEHESDEHEQCREWLVRYYAEKVPAKLPYIDVVLNRYRGRYDDLKTQLCANDADNDTFDFVEKPIDRRWLEKFYADHQPEKVAHIDRVLRQFSGREDKLKQMLLMKYMTKAVFQYAPFPTVWIIDCRTSNHIADLEQKFSATTSSGSHCNAHLPLLVVHLSPTHVAAQPRYQQWIASLSLSNWQPEHLIFDGSALQSVAQGAFGYAFVSSIKTAVRKELQIRSASNNASSRQTQKTTTVVQDLVNFLEESAWSAEHPCRREIVRRIDGCNIEAHIAQAKLQYHLLHTKSVQLGFNYERTGQAPLSRKLIVLGTGSAAPSKLRASSGMYLELSGTNAAIVDSMLVDCGEGTFGQLWRQFGGDVLERIGGMKCIWISHNHADHHCGLVRVLYEYWCFHRQQKNDILSRPMVVVAPQSVLSYVESWLPHFLRNSSEQKLIKLVTCSDFNDPHHPIRNELLARIDYAVTGITSVRVFHCYDSYGLVLTLRGGKKLVYSGDTKPCNDLVLAGMDAELLVHEATFDNTMEQDAMMKKHSTVGQALDIARRMRARQIVLTHFSQRYPSLPPVSDSGEELIKTKANVLCAYDGFVHPMPF